ncbi:hypothetical protein FACS1894137_02990 [Spirochaetia bacterium]|nr:hypothetical protein FACS1894137_02990 [Spirochaetia bacterium]
MTNKVYLEKRDCFEYPAPDAYFSPHVHYPEYPFSDDTISPYPNEVYDMVRASLFGLGLDSENYGNKRWNPLGDFVEPEARILLKPNWVYHSNRIGGLDCTVTHPSVIRCIIDYCIIAGAKLIEIGDAPIQSCNLKSLLNKYGYNYIFEFIKKKGANVLVSDFRITVSKQILKLVTIQRKTLNVDVVEFDLNGFSHFNNVSNKEKYRGLDYHDDKLNMRHHDGHHKYLITKSVFNADLIINLPKPKSHRFAGITAAQKNFVGICSEKDYLPHYRLGAPEIGGDETNYTTLLVKFLSFINKQRCKAIDKKNIIMQIFYGVIQHGIQIIFAKKKYIHGRWHGNDTIWRTILDINLILQYGNQDGTLNFDNHPRNILNIGDLIIAGEKEGPMKPSPKLLGAILASNNCVLFDYVFCKITRFDYNHIPSIKNALIDKLLFNDSLDKTFMRSNIKELCNTALDNISFPNDWAFKPHSVWKEIL